MALQFLSSLYINNIVYNVDTTDWVKTRCGWNTAIGDAYNAQDNTGIGWDLYNNAVNQTFPFSFRREGSNYPDGNPDGTILTLSSGNYFSFHNTGCNAYYSDEFIGGFSGGGSSYTRFFYVFAVDDSEQKGYIWRCVISSSSSPTSSTTFNIRFELILNVNVQNVYLKCYNLLSNGIVPSYIWSSVPSISGKLGNFNLSMVDSDYLNDGNAVTGADGSHFDRLCPDTRISALGANVPFNVETPVLYAGQVDYMSYTIEGAQVPGQPAVISAFKLKFYMAGSSTPFYTVSLTGSGLSIPDNAYLHFIIDAENQVARLSIIYRIASTNPITFNYNGESFTSEQQSQMYLWLHSHIPPEEITDSTDNIGNGDEGGDGWQPWNNIPIPRQSKPTKGGLSTGFTSMYKVNETILQDLSNFLWSDNFVDNVKKFFNDPREIIVGLMLFPVAPSASDTPTEIKAGRISTGVSAYKLLDQYLDVDMGVVNMHEETHTFLDFPPNTKASIFLPYCGEHSLDVNEIQGKVLHLKYTFDFLTGAVCAQIEVDGSCVYSFSGQCGIQLPTSSEDFSRMYSSILSAGATLGAALATVASGGLTAPLVGGTGINLLSNGMNMTPNVQSSSGGGGGSGFISNQMPFLKLEIPEPLMANGDTSEEDFESSKQYSFLGKPTYQSLTIGDCSGFTKCLDVHLVNLTGATTQEQADILRALKDGVLIESGSSTPSDTPTVAGNTVITFLKCSSENNVIGKSWDETTLALEGKLIYSQSITSPKFLVSGNVIGYNYCYIAMFSRFYFITDIVCRENGMQEISLSVDVLQSFREITSTTGIIHCKAIVERQKSKGNLYMSDGYMWTKAKKKIVTVPFMGGSYQYVNSAGQQNFERANNTYVLTIAGD